MKLIPLMVFLVLVLFFPLIKASDYVCYSIDNFNIIFNVNQSLGFQNNNILLMEVTEGTLNGSQGSLRVWNTKGEFQFQAQDDSKLKISSPDAEGLDLTVSGASKETIDVFQYMVTVQSGNSVKITWIYRIEDWASKYTMLGIGLSGLIMMIFSPTWVALGIRKKGFNEDTLMRFAYALIIFIIGFGLFISWLSG